MLLVELGKGQDFGKGQGKVWVELRAGFGEYNGDRVRIGDGVGKDVGGKLPQ